MTLPVFFLRLSIRNLQGQPRGRSLHPLSHQQPYHLRRCHELCMPQWLLQGRPGPLRHALYKYVFSRPQSTHGKAWSKGNGHRAGERLGEVTESCSGLACSLQSLPLSHTEDKVKVLIHRGAGGGLAEEPGDAYNRGCSMSELSTNLPSLQSGMIVTELTPVT